MTDNAPHGCGEKIYFPEPLLPAAFTRQPSRLPRSAHAGSLRR
jgi:hypothetical protein